MKRRMKTSNEIYSRSGEICLNNTLGRRGKDMEKLFNRIRRTLMMRLKEKKITMEREEINLEGL